MVSNPIVRGTNFLGREGPRKPVFSVYSNINRLRDASLPTGPVDPYWFEYALGFYFQNTGTPGG